MRMAHLQRRLEYHGTKELRKGGALGREREGQTKKCFSSGDLEKVQLTGFAFRKIESVSPRNYKVMSTSSS